jgi:hypothetical protein
MKGKELLNIRKSIEANRQKIVDELYDWARTFEDELDEDGEPTDEPYNEVCTLAKRLENNHCNIEDYKNILFHIWQINYDEERIKI